jgi:2-methylcitrate dehydratase PrpD
MMTVLEQLGSAIACSATPSTAGRNLVELHLIDTVGAWIAGARTTEGLALLRFRAAMGDSAQAGDAMALDLATRCALARLSEIDNIHLPSMTTPGGIVISAALTLAAATPAATADDVIAAILAGTEAMTRLGRAVDGPAILYRGIWPTYLAAPFAVAAVAARLLRLDDRATANALALALILAAPGVGHHNAASTSRWFAVGHAARNGLTAALAAQQGFTSRHLWRDAGSHSAHRRAQRTHVLDGGVVQAVVRGAADHGRDPGAPGDDRERRCARGDG